MLVAGGGATNAVCLHRARARGLGGFEFACAIPGTAGGGVWMNAGAYGSDWSAILVRALVATADGTGWLTPAELGFSYRHSSLQPRPGRRRGRVPARAARRAPRSGPRSATSSSAARRPSRRRSARSARSSRTRRASSAPGAMLELCGLKGHRIGGAADLAEARELHRERGRRDDSRLPRADGRGPPPGARGVRRRARARGRAARRHRARLTSDGSPAAPIGARRQAAKGTAWPAGDESNVDRVPVRARRGRRPASATDHRRAPRSCPARPLRPLARARVPDRRSALLVAWLGARETGVFAVRTIDVGGAPPAVATAGSQGARRRPAARACSRSTSTQSLQAVEAIPTVASASFDRAFPHTLRVVVVPERAVAIVRQGADSYLVAESGRVIADGRAPRPARRSRGSGSNRSVQLGVGEPTDGRPADGGRRRRAARRLALPGARQLRHGDRRRAHAAAPLGARDPPRRPARRAAQARRGRPGDPAARRRERRISTSPCPSGRSPEASTLRSRLMLHPRRHLEVSVDNADKESVPWLRMPVGAHSIAR